MDYKIKDLIRKATKEKIITPLTKTEIPLETVGYSLDLARFPQEFNAMMSVFPNGVKIHSLTSDEVIILPITNISPANYTVLNDVEKSIIDSSFAPDDFSWNWFVFAIVSNQNYAYIAISLNLTDYGYCYLCNWDTYPDKGNLISENILDFIQLSIDKKIPIM